jgi:hypothetical protein
MNKAMSVGGMVALILAVITVVEFVFALNVGSDQVRFVGLSVAALGKASAIVYYFMHVNRVWRKEAH